MAITAENLAVEYGITRERVRRLRDGVAAALGRRAGGGHYKAEIVPVELAGKKGTVTFAVDEHPRPQTTMEQMAKLNPVFKKDGVVTAANASGINDGAAALVLASAEYARARGLKPLARLVQWGVAAVEPKVMGIGPVPAIQKCLERAGMNLSQMDLVEVNEAFAAQYLAVEKALGLDRAKTNVDGGAIALGHPLGASGARITAHLVHALRQRDKQFAVGSACIGGGQGLAVLVERV
jgi:acetyl-CoA acyltransferase 2